MPKKKKKPEVKEVVQILRGMQDLLGSERKPWDYFFEKAKKLASGFGYEKINTPILEEQWLFKKGLGEAAEIIKKQIYEFFDRRGKIRIALRPDFAPCVMRAYIDHEMFNLPQPVRLYYSGPVFRYEKLEPKRYHQFHIFGLQSIGLDKPIADAELIVYADTLFKNLGLKVNIEINNMGCSRCRSFYRKKLYNFLKKKKKNLCVECREHLEKNPFRIFDCEKRTCQEIVLLSPQLLNSLCPKCEAYFSKALEYLDGVGVVYHLNPYLIRSADYYNGPIFEIYSSLSSEKFQSLSPKEKTALPGLPEVGGVKLGTGGRFDRLAQSLGGPSTPACGLSLGVERIVDEMKERKIKIHNGKKNRIFLCQISDLSLLEGLKLKKLLVEEGFEVVDDLKNESLSAQLEKANKLNLIFILILGHQEILDKSIIIRDLITHSQEVVSREKIVNELKKCLKR